MNANSYSQWIIDNTRIVGSQNLLLPIINKSAKLIKKRGLLNHCHILLGHAIRNKNTEQIELLSGLIRDITKRRKEQK